MHVVCSGWHRGPTVRAAPHVKSLCSRTPYNAQEFYGRQADAEKASVTPKIRRCKADQLSSQTQGISCAAEPRPLLPVNNTIKAAVEKWHFLLLQ